MIDTILMYLDFAYVRYALIVGVLIALCSSLLGVTLVLKRFSYIGDGLSHVAFGAMASALIAEKACSVSVISTHCSGVRVKPGTYRNKGLVAPPRQRPVSPGSGIHGEEQAQD